MPEVSPTLKQRDSEIIKDKKKDINILSLSVVRRDGSITHLSLIKYQMPLKRHFLLKQKLGITKIKIKNKKIMFTEQ